MLNPNEGETVEVSAGGMESESQDLGEKISRLEKVVRGSGRDMLALTRGQRETQEAVQALQTRLDDLELAIKGVSQNVWRASQENQARSQAVEDQVAGVLRDLEKRVRDELQFQIYKNAVQAIFPALDDMDHVLEQGSALEGAQADGVLQAMLLVRRKFNDSLRRLGLDEIEVREGQTLFDPALHQAAAPDLVPPGLQEKDAPPGTILKVIRAGYGLNGRVLRAPQVIVKS